MEAEPVGPEDAFNGADTIAVRRCEMSSRCKAVLVLAVVWVVLCAALTLGVASPGFAAEVETRLVNNGQVVLEGVPEVPQKLVEALNRYLNVRSASFQDWGSDGESMFVATRFGNTTQLHHVATPGGARHQLTFFAEPLSGAKRQPDGSMLIFEKDEGGGEFYQIFALDPNTGDSWRLTDGESKNAAPVWSPDGTLIAFESTRRNRASNDVWLMSFDNPEDARMVFESPDGSSWEPKDFSPDGKTLLLEQYVSITDVRIHLIDLESGASRKLVDKGRRAVHFPVSRNKAPARGHAGLLPGAC